MLLPLTDHFNAKKVAVDLNNVSRIEEYEPNGSKISIVNQDGRFLNYLYIKESIDEICEIANRIKASNKNHQITIYYRKSQFD